MLNTAWNFRLAMQLVRVCALHARELREGAGQVVLPTALERKAPSWTADPAWQWVFPASRRYRDVEGAAWRVGITCTRR